MRIGFFSECGPPTTNGVITSMDSFRKAMEEMGHEVFVFAPATKGYKDEDPSHIFRYPSFNKIWFIPNDYPFGLPFLAPSLYRKARSLNLDIIHAQHSLGLISAQAKKIARKENIPIVHTYHTMLTEYIHWPVFANVGKWYVKKMSTRFCNKCDQIVTPSPSMKKIVEGYGVTTPIEPIPTGIDLSEFQNPFTREELKEKWDIPTDKKLLIYLSRIATEKNLIFLFESIKILASKRNDFHVVLIGGGKEFAYFKRKAKEMGIEAVVTFTDKQPLNIAHRILRDDAIFIFPSFTETQGIVIAESMAAGMPAVAVGIMGPTDIIKNGIDGYLVSLSQNEFSGRIEYLLENDSERAKMGAQAKEDAKQYSIQNCAKEMISLYEKNINSHRSKQNIT